MNLGDLEISIGQRLEHIGLLADRVTIPESVWEFIEQLTPEDVGQEKIGKLRVVFEGFTAACWEDALAEGKSLAALEAEILEGWNARNGQAIAVGWLRDLDFGEDNVFWAIYKG